MGAIPPPLVTQIFDPLTGGQRRRDRSRGLGLGLFITQRIAEAHGGDVAVSSSETDGTTFTVSLPRVTDGAVSAAALARTGAAASHENVNLAALAQDQLRESQTRFRLLVEAVKDYAIFMLDPSGRVVTWNAGAERIKGYEAARDPRPPFLGVLRRRGGPLRQVRARAGGGRARGPVRGRGLARPQGRHEVLGERGHHRAAHRERRAGRLRQGDPRSDRAPPPGRGAPAAWPRRRRRSACATNSCRWPRTS